jgi:hypothetical protein
MKHWILPAMALVLAACAGAPEPKDTTVAAASVPAASGSAMSAPAVAETASGVASGSGSMQVRTDEPTVAKSRPGYRARQRGGETVWCRTETPTGSRMPVENCYSAAQLDAIDADAETMKDSINSTRQRCSGASCSNGS